MHDLYTVDQVIYAFSPENPVFFAQAIALLLAMSFGLLEYIWATRLALREHKTPFPVWMHAFMFAHDLTAGIVMLYFGITNDFFWYFMLQGGGMVVWSILEITNMRTAIKYETQETWGSETTKAQSTIYTIILAAFFLVIVNIMRYLMNDEAAQLWLPITNIVMAVGPGFILYHRRSREGSSVMLYIIILAGTIFNFLPQGLGCFTTALPWIWNQPIYFIVGAVTIAIAVYNLYYICKLPAKPKIEGEKKPIW